MTRFTTPPIGRLPTKMPLRGTVIGRQSNLSHQADIALSWAVKAVGAAHNQTPTGSAVTRRALLRYVDWLSDLSDLEMEQEARAVLAASKALQVSDEERQRALDALDTDPLTPWRDVQMDPKARAEIQAFNARLAHLMEPPTKKHNQG